MSRATRRQQQRGAARQSAKKQQQPRAVLAKSQTKPAGTPQQTKRGFLPRWITDIFAELRRVVWPSREETTNLTIVVIIVAVAMGVILGGIDLAFEWGVENILLSAVLTR
ncbi:MAG TPA: preprotein translocase subunit SecE [Dehalococcoidia bacterium]|nr:preprotein translocase subunit SecE [Dehalococcoidia bacterium]